MNKKIKAIDLFSGAGGLSSGLRMAGINVIGSVEIDPDAVNTYKSNFPDATVHATDVQDIDFSQYKGIDLIVGGPPCQPFSVAGKQLAENDPRDMVPQFIRAVREARPRAFMMENVAGLMNKRHKYYSDKAACDLEDLGYNVTVKVLSAYDYGVAQRRQRVFFVGLEKGYFHYPEPTHGPGCKYPHLTAREALHNVPEDEPNRAKVTYAKRPVLRPSPFAGMMVNGQGRPINLDGPCHTIPATAGGNRTHIYDPEGILVEYHQHLMNGGNPRHGQVEGVRRLTVRESARIQSFPDEFNFIGKRSAKYRLIGNAVPPLLAKAIATSIISALESASKVHKFPAREVFTVHRDILGRGELRVMSA